MAGTERRGRFTSHWLPVIVWMATIMVGTSLPRAPGLAVEGGDKIAHFVAYGLLGGLLLRAFMGAGQGLWAAALATLASGATYGAVDEVHQAFLPTRTCSVEDLAADVMGLGLAVLVGWLVMSVARRHTGSEHITTRQIGEMSDMSEELTLSQDNFEGEILQADVPCLVDFWAPWCGPCLMMGPTIEKLAGEYAGKAKVGKINVDENPELANKYGIRSIPSLLLFKGGEVVDMVVGVQPEDALRQKLEALMG